MLPDPNTNENTELFRKEEPLTSNNTPPTYNDPTTKPLTIEKKVLYFLLASMGSGLGLYALGAIIGSIFPPVGFIIGLTGLTIIGITAVASIACAAALLGRYIYKRLTKQTNTPELQQNLINNHNPSLANNITTQEQSTQTSQDQSTQTSPEQSNEDNAEILPGNQQPQNLVNSLSQQPTQYSIMSQNTTQPKNTTQKTTPHTTLANTKNHRNTTKVNTKDQAVVTAKTVTGNKKQPSASMKK